MTSSDSPRDQEPREALRAMLKDALRAAVFLVNAFLFGVAAQRSGSAPATTRSCADTTANGTIDAALSAVPSSTGENQ